MIGGRRHSARHSKRDSAGRSLRAGQNVQIEVSIRQTQNYSYESSLGYAGSCHQRMPTLKLIRVMRVEKVTNIAPPTVSMRCFSTRAPQPQIVILLRGCTGHEMATGWSSWFVTTRDDLAVAAGLQRRRPRHRVGCHVSSLPRPAALARSAPGHAPGTPGWQRSAPCTLPVARPATGACGKRASRRGFRPDWATARRGRAGSTRISAPVGAQTGEPGDASAPGEPCPAQPSTSARRPVDRLRLLPWSGIARLE
jgi:hypothetical protein